MANKETKQDILVTLLIVAIIGTIAGAILYSQSLEKQTPPVDPNPDENNQTNPDNNNNTTNPDNPDTNTTNPDNGNVTEPDYFEQVCNIKPTAEVCIKPINSTNSNTTSY